MSVSFMEQNAPQGNSRQQKQVDGYINLKVTFKDKNGKEYVLPSPYFPIYKDKKESKAVLDHHEYMMQNLKVEVSSIRVVDHDDTPIDLGLEEEPEL